MLVVLYAAIHGKEKGYHVRDVSHVLLLLGRTFVFGLRTKIRKNLKKTFFKPKDKNLFFTKLRFSIPEYAAIYRNMPHILTYVTTRKTTQDNSRRRNAKNTHPV